MLSPGERPAFELADIVRAHGAELRERHFVSPRQAKVLRHIAQCRTSALGGHRDSCELCGHEQVSYNSCRDRHCPKCQGTERAKWIERRVEHVLPVPYFHVVFTLPAELHPLVLSNKASLYSLLFEASSKALLELARDERRLGAQLGFTAVLHSWGQRLLFHPHVHCVVTGGGLSRDGSRWVDADPSYLLPVRALSRLFRGKFLAGLQSAWRSGKLRLIGRNAALSDEPVWSAFRDRLYRSNWVVYSKPPFAGPEQVYRYLGRYTHRIAITNRRIVAFANGKVSFRWRDYAAGAKWKLLELDAVEFLRRFLLHVLPRRFVRLRHYGLHAASNVSTRLVQARKLLEARRQTGRQRELATGGAAEEQAQPPETTILGHDRTPPLCPRCRQARLVRVTLQPTMRLVRAPPRAS